MTLEALFKLLDKQFAGQKYTATFDYRLRLEYEHVTPYPYDDGISTYEQDITEIEVNNETRTITFKGESK